MAWNLPPNVSCKADKNANTVRHDIYLVIRPSKESAWPEALTYFRSRTSSEDHESESRRMQIAEKPTPACARTVPVPPKRDIEPSG